MHSLSSPKVASQALFEIDPAISTPQSALGIPATLCAELRAALPSHSFAISQLAILAHCSLFIISCALSKIPVLDVACLLMLSI